MSRFKMRNLLKFSRAKSTTDLSEWNKNDEKLLKGVEAEDLKKVASVLNKKTLNPTKLGPRGHSVFHIACAVGNDQIVELLLKHSDDVNDLTIQGNTALQLAAAKGHSTVVQKLLQAGADVDMNDSNNMTALHHACAGVHFECVQSLLRGGASATSKEKTGKTALFFAAHRGDIATCKWLVDQGTDVNAQDMYKTTSLMVAAQKGHSEVCQFLLKKGAHPDFQDREGHTALAHAISHGHIELKEVFARAPTRASWDVHGDNVPAAKTPSGASSSAVSHPEPVSVTPVTPVTPVAPDQVDLVDKFDTSESPELARREVGDERDEDIPQGTLRKVQSETWDRPNNLEELEMKPSSDTRTAQAFKELEEEHEQLNEDYHNLTLENRKLYDKIDFLTKRLAQSKQGRVEIPQEIEDEINNLKNLLNKEQEKTQELAVHTQTLAEQNQKLSVENQNLVHKAYKSERKQARDRDQNEDMPEDSWGDSDEELFDSPNRNRKNPSSPDDHQMMMLLRSQILTLRQENDQLKEKMQSLPNGYRESPPKLPDAEVSEADSGLGKTEAQDDLQDVVNRLETEKESLEKELLSMKESSQIDMLNGSIGHEELLVENKRLVEEVEVLHGQLKEKSLKFVEVSLSEPDKVNSEVPEEESDTEHSKQSKHSLEALKTENEHLHGQCEVLQEELDKLRLTFNAILKAGDNLQADFDQLQVEKEQLQEEYERSIQEKEDMAKENDFLLTDGNALHEDLKKLVHELENMQEKYKKLQTEKEELISEKEDLERKIVAVNLSGKVGEFTKLLEERDKLKAHNEELEATSYRLEHDQEILLEEVQSVQEHMKMAVAERDQLQGEVDEFEGILQQFDVLQQDYAQLEQDYTELLKDKDRLEQELMNKQSSSLEMETIPEDNEKLTKEIETLAEEKEQLELTVQELGRTNTILEDDLKRARCDLEEAKRSLETNTVVNGDITSPKSSMNAGTSERPRAEKSLKIKSLQTQISHLQQQLADFDRQHQDIVSVYRTHLISAVQGHMDPDVKQSLHQIIELRSMEQFC